MYSVKHLRAHICCNPGTRLERVCNKAIKELEAGRPLSPELAASVTRVLDKYAHKGGFDFAIRVGAIA
jgi:hypothetical protein